MVMMYMIRKIEERAIIIGRTNKMDMKEISEKGKNEMKFEGELQEEVWQS
jgi:hypothetical protein